MKLMSPALTIIFFMAMSLQGQGPATWTSTESYTYPSLVIDNGVTYISKQNVPVGTLITNETYWVTLDSQVPDETPTGQDDLSTPDVSTKPNDIPDGVEDTTGSNSSATPVDLNGDDILDIVWQKSGTNETKFWYMNTDCSKKSEFDLVHSAGSVWKLSSLGDMNNDGNVDLLWQKEDG